MKIFYNGIRVDAKRESQSYDNKIAQNIANHKEGKHFYEEEKKWNKLGIKNLKNFENHIYESISIPPDKSHHCINNRIISYYKERKIFLIINLSEKDKGTAFYAKNDAKFRKEVAKDLAREKLFSLNKLNKKDLTDNTLEIKRHRAAKQLQKLQKYKIKSLQKVEERRERNEHKRMLAKLAATRREREEKKKANGLAKNSQIKKSAQLVKQKEQALQNSRINEQKKQEDLKRKIEKQRRQEQERQRKLEEERRRRELERLYRMNSNDITKRY